MKGVPEVIPAEASDLGRQQALVLLAKLVEAEIPDGTKRRAARHASPVTVS